jgi:putative DNA primase/helicase
MNDVVNLVEKTLNDTRPIIRIVAGELAEITRQAERTILSSGIYQRGPFLVRAVIQEVDAAHGRKTKTAQLIQLDKAYLRLVLAEAARWERYNIRKNDWLATDPPSDIAAGILSRFGDWQFAPVCGVLTTPTMRPDGSILSEPGYDPATRLLLIDPPPMPRIPNEPTREDALAALELLDDLLEEFPLADPPSRAVALSAAISTVARGAYANVPMHAIRSPEAGTGKSYLNDTVSVIATGKLMPVMAAGKDEAETEKRLGAALLAGQPLISIDNVNGILGGDALCQAIERPAVQIRILGRSEQPTIEPRSTSIFATGNNLTVSGDLTRRVLVATLDSKMEHPEDREFSGEPVRDVLADRGKYIAACLTICRAYAVAGRPEPMPRLPSFEGWSDTVRSALVWLGCADPVETLHSARADDPARMVLQDVLANWAESIGTGYGSRMKIAEVVKRAVEKEVPSGGEYYEQHETDWRHSDLRDALVAVAGDRGRIDHNRLGFWLRSNKGKIANGRCFTNDADKHRHIGSWWVEEV